MARKTWTAAEIRELGVHTDVPTAGSILGMERTKAYGLASRDQFPVPVLRHGRRILVPVAGLLALLGIPVEEPPSHDDAL
jgi:hypothetical protein